MDVSLDWLLVGRGPMRFEQLMGRGMRLSKPEIIPPEAPVPAGLPDGYAVIPRYEARAGAGAGVINPSDRIVEQMVVSEEYIRRRLRRRPEDMALLEALGDSMSPTIQDGDVMMIDVSVTELRASSIYVLLMDEELIVKRLHKMTDGRILIIPDNERYPREEVTPSERAPLRIVGQVVWYGRPMPG
jgi:phage repressor protein C with HTH and peptisase S24 domain